MFEVIDEDLHEFSRHVEFVEKPNFATYSSVEPSSAR